MPIPARRPRDPGSAMAVDDPGAVEVVLGQLHPYAVAGQDPDPEAAHLARDVPEDGVAVVELDAEHGVRKGLHDLALELDLVLLGHARRTLPAPYGPVGRLAPVLLAGAGVGAARGGRRLRRRG